MAPFADGRIGRAGVVLLDGNRVALIRRVRQGHTYYIFPGGGVQPDESFEAAAVREAVEELGLDVELGGVVHTEQARGVDFRYFAARVVGGRFGSGLGEELRTSGSTVKGTYEAVWVPLAELARRDVRPRPLAALVARGRVRPKRRSRRRSGG